MPHFWRYDQVEPRDDVLLGIPDTWKIEVYKIQSGDSGKVYYVQLLSSEIPKIVGRGDSGRTWIYLCNCPEGVFRAPLSVLGIESPCKHASHLADFLKEKKKK